jgi:tryptophan halogenase
MNKKCKIAIVGGGAAGFFTAAAIARNCKNTDITVIHDPKIPFVGVGESLGWFGPLFFNQYLGLNDDAVWLKPSGSTYKYSVALQNWHQEDNKPYFMTFPFNPSYKILYRSIWDSAKDKAYIDHDGEYNLYSMLLHLRAKNLIDKDNFQQYSNEFFWFCKYNTSAISTEGKWASQLYWGHSYHINSTHIRHIVHKLVGEPNGVKVLEQRIKKVQLAENGDIDTLLLDSDEEFKADLYIDCSGFQRLLAKNLPFEFEHCDRFFNNSALVGQHKFKSNDEYHANTLTCAMNYGWRFSIPCDGRSGEGYQYNSRIFDNEEKLVEEYYKKTSNTDVEFRKIKWEPGYHKKAFVKNCITVGLSNGFSDVFDANNFTAAIRHMSKIVDYLKNDNKFSFGWRDEYNEMVRSGSKQIILRIQSAFHLARRNDTEYWRQMKIAARELDTENRLIEAALSQDHRMYPGAVCKTGDPYRLYTNHIFINQALYNQTPLPVERCLLPIDEYTEKLALEFFYYFKNTYELKARHSQPWAKFYESNYSKMSSNKSELTIYQDFMG